MSLVYFVHYLGYLVFSVPWGIFRHHTRVLPIFHGKKTNKYKLCLLGEGRIKDVEHGSLTLIRGASNFRFRRVHVNLVKHQDDPVMPRYSLSQTGKVVVFLNIISFLYFSLLPVLIPVSFHSNKKKLQDYQLPEGRISSVKEFDFVKLNNYSYHTWKVIPCPTMMLGSRMQSK